MKCQWKECENDATRIVFRPVEGIGKDAQKRRIWNENLSVCDTCLEPAQTEYPYKSHVPPDREQADCRTGCFR